MTGSSTVLQSSDATRCMSYGCSIVVYTVTNAGRSDATTPVAMTMAAPPDVPSGVSVVWDSSGQVVVSWSPVTGATGNEVERTYLNTNYPATLTTTMTTVSATSLAVVGSDRLAGTCAFRVFAKDTLGLSGPSSRVEVPGQSAPGIHSNVWVHQYCCMVIRW